MNLLLAVVVGGQGAHPWVLTCGDSGTPARPETNSRAWGQEVTCPTWHNGQCSQGPVSPARASFLNLVCAETCVTKHSLSSGNQKREGDKCGTFSKEKD